MASKIKQKILDELLQAYNLTSSETKQDLLSGLYENVDKLDDDREIRNLLWANREVPMRMFSGDDLTIMPSVGEIMSSPMPDDNVDLAKQFGPDWVNNFENIPVSQIQFVADKAGVDWKNLLAEMQDQAVKQRRQDIANESFVTKAVAPRSVEAVARGESPTTKDVIGDIGQNALYATPWGGIARGLGATSKVAGALMRGAASNVTAPLAGEIYDANVYEDENPRGEFSVADVAGGAATNVVAPAVLRGAFSRVGYFVPALKGLSEFGTGRTAKEVADEVVGQYRYAPVRKAFDPSVPVAERKIAEEMVQLRSSQPDLYRLLTSNPRGPIPQGSKWASMQNIMGTPGKSLKEKVDNYLLSRGYKEAHLTPEGQIVEGPGEIPKSLMDYYDKSAGAVASESAKTAEQIAKEEAAKNWITNNFGDYLSEEGKVYSRIPFVGPYIQKKVDEAEAEELERLKEEELMNKWKIRLGVK